MSARLSWQAQTVVGTAHGYLALRPGERALCSGSVRRVDGRWEREIKSHCRGCLMEATRLGLMPEGQVSIWTRPPER